ncbi:MAG: aminomethyltransferase [Saprospiraceae bacterium]|jgi:aminomethyltransferase
MKKTALYEQHIAMGAKMVPFAGWEMPVRYGSTLGDEHFAVRNSVGVFDVSHMGEFIISGPKALELLSFVSSNDPSTLEIGDAQYSCLPNDSTGIVDDMIIYRTDLEEYMLVVNASNIDKDWDWIASHNTMKANMSNISDEIALIAVQGPNAAALLSYITDVDLEAIAFYHFTKGSIASIDDVIISSTGYTGSGGFELYVPTGSASKIWEAIFNIDSDIDVAPAGLGARDTLRLEMGYCLYGNDIDNTTSALEAGLGWITKWNHEFIQKEKLQTQKETGLTRRLVALKMQDKGIPRQGYDVLNSDGKIIGKITSGTISPMLDIGIGMGYVEVPYHKKGTEVLIQIRKKQLPATITKAPFVNLK